MPSKERPINFTAPMVREIMDGSWDANPFVWVINFKNISGQT
jgi:hypothetical protein